MSQENVEMVRQPIAVNAHSRRRLGERLGLRFPATVALLARLVFRLPPRFRLRLELIRRGVQMGYEATNRGDYDAAFMLYHPDVELLIHPEFVGLGFDPSYRGRDERVRFQQRWTAEWGEMRFAPKR